MKRAHALAISILVVLAVALGAATVFQSSARSPAPAASLAPSDADIAKEQRRLDALQRDIDEELRTAASASTEAVTSSSPRTPTAPAARNDIGRALVEVFDHDGDHDDDDHRDDHGNRDDDHDDHGAYRDDD